MPDLVILDLNIPKVSGISVLDQYEPKEAPPIVVFSSTWGQTEIRRALKLFACALTYRLLLMRSVGLSASGRFGAERARDGGNERVSQTAVFKNAANARVARLGHQKHIAPVAGDRSELLVLEEDDGTPHPAIWTLGRHGTSLYLGCMIPLEVPEGGIDVASRHRRS